MSNDVIRILKKTVEQLESQQEEEPIVKSLDLDDLVVRICERTGFCPKVMKKIIRESLEEMSKEEEKN